MTGGKSIETMQAAQQKRQEEEESKRREEEAVAAKAKADQQELDELNTDGEPPELDYDAAAVINGMMVRCGSKKNQTEEEKRLAEYHDIYNAIETVSQLTKNPPHVLACCIDKVTVDATTLTGYNYRLPMYPMRGNNMQNLVHLFAMKCWESYIAKQKEAHQRATKGTVANLPDADWNVLSKNLGLGIRFSIQYWVLNKPLTRKEAYDQAKAQMYKLITPKNKPKHIIEKMCDERKLSDTKAAIEKLRIERDEDQKKNVFTQEDDFSSDEVMTNFLQARSFKYKKHEYPHGVLEAFQAYIDKNPESFLERFQKEVFTFRQTEDFKSLQAHIAEKMKKSDELDAKRKKREEEKQEKIKKQEEKTMLQQSKLLSKAGMSGAVDFPASMEKVPQRKLPLTRKRKETPEVLEAQQISDFIATTLPQLKFEKRDLKPHEIAGTAGPIKIIKSIDLVKKSITGEYHAPDEDCKTKFKAHFHNINRFLDLLEEADQTFMASIYTVAEGFLGLNTKRLRDGSTGPWISMEGLLTAVSVLADSTGFVKYQVKEGSFEVEEFTVPLFSSNGQLSLLQDDLAFILPTIVSPRTVGSFAMTTTAFSIISRNYGRGDAATAKLLKQVTENMEKSSGDQILLLVEIVKMIQECPDFTTENSKNFFHPFHIKFSCVIPTAIAHQKNHDSTKKKKKDTLINRTLHAILNPDEGA